MNAHDSIVAATVARLLQAPALAGGFVEEELQPGAVPEEVSQAISVRLSRSVAQDTRYAGHPIDWQSELVIECYARGDAANPSTGRASRALHAAAYARLMAEPSLGGQVSYLVPVAIDVDTEAATGPHGVCIGTYTAVHRTAAATLEAP